MIEASGLTFAYPGAAAIGFPEVRVESGGKCLLLGKSGSGKTTLLHLLGGLLRPAGGSVRISGNEITAMDGPDLDRFRGRQVGFIFQQHHLVDSLSVRQNLLLSGYCANLDADYKRADELMARLGLSGKERALPGKLSQGQQQRVVIARALMNRPSVLLADEPTSALDDHHCELVAALLKELVQQSGTALLIATHDQRLKDLIENRVEL